MFKSIILDHGAAAQAILAFAITSSVFGLIILRTWRMKKEDSLHLANLPLDDDSEKQHTH
jgi:hypothetical protein